MTRSTRISRPGSALLALGGAAILLLGASSASASVVLQYGYDYTTGTVTSQGNQVNDDGGNGNHAVTKVGLNAAGDGGDGGSYSADIPNPAMLQNTTGVGSVDITTGVHWTTNVDVINNADILNNNGLTMQAWVKPNSTAGTTTGSGHISQIIISESGAFGMSVGTGDADDGVVRLGAFAAGSSGAIGLYADAPEGEWSHVAVVIRDVSPGAQPNELNATFEVFLNGQSVGTQDSTNLKTGADYSAVGSGLGRTITIGAHSYAGYGWNFDGLIFEPTITLGALEPGDFTIVPEPASLALLGLGATLLVGRRRRLQR